MSDILIIDSSSIVNLRQGSLRVILFVDKDRDALIFGDLRHPLQLRVVRHGDPRRCDKRRVCQPLRYVTSSER